MFKLKILLFPFALIISLAIVMSYIWPTGMEIRRMRGEISAKEKELDEMVKKRDNISRLQENLNENPGREDTVIRYLPLDKKEEVILHSLNYLATDTGLALTEMSWRDISGAKQRDVVGVEMQDGKASDSSVEVTLIALGNYQQVWNFLELLFSLERLNLVSSVKISKVEMGGEIQSPDELPEAVSDVLELEVVSVFKYVPRGVLSKSVSLDIFSKQGFDFATVEKMVGLTKIPELRVDQKGTRDPFKPAQPAQ